MKPPIFNGTTSRTIVKQGLVLTKSGAGFEAEGVLNPAVIEHDGSIHMFYRALAEGNRSTIGYARLDTPLTVEYRANYPVLFPETAEESQGVEDPRIVKIDDTFFLTYTAYDGHNALGALATSTDLKGFVKYGVIAPHIGSREFAAAAKKCGDAHVKYFRLDQSSPLMWDKNLVFFPRKILGKFALLHRIRPGIQLALMDDPREIPPGYWGDYFGEFTSHIVMDPRYEHEMSYLGPGCPPIETPEGWLIIYHSVFDTIEGYVYVACAALLDLQDPTKEIARLPYPLFVPDREYERHGEVNNVCFPTGTILRHGKLYIYYGAADDKIACASVEMQELINELKATRIP